jgi:site-specific recombinase XerD
MCYKEEEQKKAKDKLEEKIKYMPKYIKEYFVFLSSNTSKLAYWSTIRLFLEWLIDNKIINNTIENISQEDLSEVTDVDVINYLDSLLENKVSPDTVKTKKNNLSGFWSYLVDKGYVQKNIITKSVSMKYKVEDSDREIKVPTEEQLQMVINNLEAMKSEITALRNIAIVKLFMGTGIRLSELVGLDIDDLHFDYEFPTITIWAKGKKKSREVLVNQSAVFAVSDYLKVRNANPELKDLQPLFLSERKDDNGNNKRLAVSSVEDFMKKYSNGKLHPHLLRHYAGTKMYENSNNIVGVCDQLGHGDIKTTKKYYVKSDKSSMMTALNSF